MLPCNVLTCIVSDYQVCDLYNIACLDFEIIELLQQFCGNTHTTGEGILHNMYIQILCTCMHIQSYAQCN